MFIVRCEGVPGALLYLIKVGMQFGRYVFLDFLFTLTLILSHFSLLSQQKHECCWASFLLFPSLSFLLSFFLSFSVSLASALRQARTDVRTLQRKRRRRNSFSYIVARSTHFLFSGHLKLLFPPHSPALDAMKRKIRKTDS
jgi:hypothetical protein